MPVAAKYKFKEHGATVKPCTNLPIATEDQITLFKAIKDDDSDTLTKYLDGGGNLNIRHQWLPEAWMPHDVDDADQWNSNITPVHFATLRNRVNILQVLLENGADPNIHLQSQWRDTPLALAHFRGNHNAISVLKQHGAEVYKFPRTWQWYLQLVMLFVGIVQMLVDVGSDINVAVTFFLGVPVKDTKCNCVVHKPTWGFGIGAVLILVLSDVITFLLLLKYSPVKYASAPYAWKLVPIVPVYEILSFWKAISFHWFQFSRRMSENMERHQRALNMLEAVFQSFPQLLLQIVSYIYIKATYEKGQSDDLYTQVSMYLSFAMSFISVVKAVATYIYIRRSENVNFFGVETALAKKSTTAKAQAKAEERDRGATSNAVSMRSVVGGKGDAEDPLLADEESEVEERVGLGGAVRAEREMKEKNRGASPHHKGDAPPPSLTAPKKPANNGKSPRRRDDDDDDE